MSSNVEKELRYRVKVMARDCTITVAGDRDTSLAMFIERAYRSANGIPTNKVDRMKQDKLYIKRNKVYYDQAKVDFKLTPNSLNMQPKRDRIILKDDLNNDKRVEKRKRKVPLLLLEQSGRSETIENVLQINSSLSIDHIEPVRPVANIDDFKSSDDIQTISPMQPVEPVAPVALFTLTALVSTATPTIQLEPIPQSIPTNQADSTLQADLNYLLSPRVSYIHLDICAHNSIHTIRGRMDSTVYKFVFKAFCISNSVIDKETREELFFNFIAKRQVLYKLGVVDKNDTPQSLHMVPFDQVFVCDSFNTALSSHN